MSSESNPRVSSEPGKPSVVKWQLVLFAAAEGAAVLFGYHIISGVVLFASLVLLPFVHVYQKAPESLTLGLDKQSGPLHP